MNDILKFIGNNAKSTKYSDIASYLNKQFDVIAQSPEGAIQILSQLDVVQNSTFFLFIASPIFFSREVHRDIKPQNSDLLRHMTAFLNNFDDN